MGPIMTSEVTLYLIKICVFIVSASKSVHNEYARKKKAKISESRIYVVADLHSHGVFLLRYRRTYFNYFKIIGFCI